MNMVENEHLHYTLNAMLFIEQYVDNYSEEKIILSSEYLDYLINNYVYEDAEYSLAVLNKEYYSQGLYEKPPYRQAMEELKSIYKHTMEIMSEVGQYKNVAPRRGSTLTICNKPHKMSYGVSLEKCNGKDVLVIERGFLGKIYDLWNSNKNDVIIVKDTVGSYYKFIYDGEFYILEEVYSFNIQDELQYKGIVYMTPLGARMMIES